MEGDWVKKRHLKPRQIDCDQRGQKAKKKNS